MFWEFLGFHSRALYIPILLEYVPMSMIDWQAFQEGILDSSLRV